MRQESEDYEKGVCTMCGSLCSMNIDSYSSALSHEAKEKFVRAIEGKRAGHEIESRGATL